MGYTLLPEAVWKSGEVGVISKVTVDATGQVWARVTVHSASIHGLWGHVLCPGKFCSIRPCHVHINTEATLVEMDEENNERKQEFLEMTRNIYRTDANYQSKQGNLSQTGQKRASELTWEDYRTSFANGILRPP